MIQEKSKKINCQSSLKASNFKKDFPYTVVNKACLTE